jgi:hypothetical protein
MMFGLYSKIAAAVMLAVFLAGVYWKGHTQGYKARDTIAQADDAARAADALQASETARLRERSMRVDFAKVDHELQAQKVLRAAGDKRNADSVQRIEALLADIRTNGDTGGASGTDDPRNGIIAECTGVVRQLDQEVRRLLDKVGALQKLSSIVRVKP